MEKPIFIIEMPIEAYREYTSKDLKKACLKIKKDFKNEYHVLIVGMPLEKFQYKIIR